MASSKYGVVHPLSLFIYEWLKCRCRNVICTTRSLYSVTIQFGKGKYIWLTIQTIHIKYGNHRGLPKTVHTKWMQAKKSHQNLPCDRLMQFYSNCLHRHHCKDIVCPSSSFSLTSSTRISESGIRDVAGGCIASGMAWRITDCAHS